VISSLVASPRNGATGAGLLLLGIPVYLWWRRPRLAAAGDGAGRTT
jgi:hypothetical protein